MLEPRMSRRQRIIAHRLIITGDLRLLTPTHLGNGDSEGATDMTLLRDSRDPKLALLTGATLAGALRSYLRAYEQGLFGAEQPADDLAAKGMAELLFGGRKAHDSGVQSPLIVNDALAAPASYELRDGVKIDPATRTPAEKTKYDLELLSAGTSFPLRFELNIPTLVNTDGSDLPAATQQGYERRLRTALALALDGLARGAIGLGMKKRRGFGRCEVARWRVWEFDLTERDALLDWLAFGRDGWQATTVARESAAIFDVLNADRPTQRDRRQRLTLTATFALDGSLLIRSGHDQAVLGPDVRHLHARQPEGGELPVISGTSLAGVLRHRAERIANTLVPGSGPRFTARMFGRVGDSSRTGDSGQASRLVVHESAVTDARTDLVQNRVSIDRFTGGAFDGALFNAQPAFARPETRVTLRLELLEPEEGERAMLLLLLKDLWTGDLPIGGESSVGRGRLRGREATLCDGDAIVARFAGDGARVTLPEGDRDALNAEVAALKGLLADPKKEASHVGP